MFVVAEWVEEGADGTTLDGLMGVFGDGDAAAAFVASLATVAVPLVVREIDCEFPLLLVRGWPGTSASGCWSSAQLGARWPQASQASAASAASPTRVAFNVYAVRAETINRSFPTEGILSKLPHYHVTDDDFGDEGWAHVRHYLLGA